MNNETNPNHLFQANGGGGTPNLSPYPPNITNGQYPVYPQGTENSLNHNTNRQEQSINGQVGIPLQEAMPMRAPFPTVENSVQESQKAIIPTESFTEMPFAGVNQQELTEKQTAILPNTISVEKGEQDSYASKNSNMQPVEKKADENAGLKFLLLIFVLLLIVILCLPLIGLN